MLLVPLDVFMFVLLASSHLHLLPFLEVNYADAITIGLIHGTMARASIQSSIRI